MKVQRLGLIFIGLVCLSLSWTWKASSLQKAEQYDLGTIDLLSQTMNINRNTELSEVKPVENTSENDRDLIKDLIRRDPELKQKWDMKLTDTLTAWRRHKVFGDNAIKVCVIDTGVDTKHPQIAEKLDMNVGETCPGKNGQRILCDKSRNGVDDDSNGFVDDVYGYDFALDRGQLDDKHGHGTHIAGIIAGDSGYGIAPDVKLIIAKYYDPKAPGNNNLLNTVRAIRYCTQRQADIINYSGGGLEPSALEIKAIEEAKTPTGRPILFIAAAGNERSNSDIKKYYPADYDLPNIISVTAIDSDLNVLSSSNYGSNSVDIAAPGKSIMSLIPGGKFGNMTGTSQATAIVTGAAALIKTKFPDYSASEIISALTESGDYRPDKLIGKTTQKKSLNIYRALAIIGEDVSVSGAKPNNVMNLEPNAFSIQTPSQSNNGAMGLSPTKLNEMLKAAEKDLKKSNRRIGVKD